MPAFSLRLDPPPPSDLARAHQLAEISSNSYGRDAVDVDLDLQSALERIHGPRWSGWPTVDVQAQDDTNTTPDSEDGVPAIDGIVAGTKVPRGKAPRAEGTRKTRTRRSRPRRDTGLTSASDAGPKQHEEPTGEDG